MRFSYFIFHKKSSARLLLSVMAITLLSHCSQQRYPAIEFNRSPSFYKENSTPPQVQASSALLVHYPSMSIVYEKNAQIERPIASLQKLITGLLVNNPDRLQQKIVLQKKDFKAYDPQSVKLKPNEAYTREQLMKMLLISSNNIAANALARVHSGSTKSFIKKMNDLALELGMNNSHFKNAHGLTQSNQYSTAVDATKMAIHAYQSTFIASLCSQPQAPLYDSKQQTLNNTNALLKQTTIAQDYRCVGLKTGYTQASGYCLSLVITNDRETFFLTLLNSTRAQIYNDARKLFKHAIHSSYFRHQAKPVQTNNPFISYGSIQ